MNDEMTYRVFTRRPWAGSKRAGFVPRACHPGNTLASGLTLEDARAMCAGGAANKARKAGKEYRHLAFREFTSEAQS